MMHISAETVSAFVIGILCSFAPGVLFLVAWMMATCERRRLELIVRCAQSNDD